MTEKIFFGFLQWLSDSEHKTLTMDSTIWADFWLFCWTHIQTDTLALSFLHNSVIIWLGKKCVYRLTAIAGDALKRTNYNSNNYWLTALGSVRMLSNREHFLTVFVFYDLFTILSHRQLPLCQEYCPPLTWHIACILFADGQQELPVASLLSTWSRYPTERTQYHQHA